MAEAQPHPSQLVAEAGAALFGEDWAAPLARLLDLNERTVRRLKAAAIAGQPYPIAPGVLAELKAALLAQAQGLQHLARRFP